MNNDNYDPTKDRRITASWLWAGFWDGLIFGFIWRWLGYNVPLATQCSAFHRTNTTNYFCQKASNHRGAHIDTRGECWK